MRKTAVLRTKRIAWALLVTALTAAAGCGEVTAPMPSPESCDLISGAQDSAWSCD